MDFTASVTYINYCYLCTFILFSHLHMTDIVPSQCLYLSVSLSLCHPLLMTKNMRNGYGRISTQKARSMDDSTSEADDGKGEIFGVILGRSASVSSSSCSASEGFEVTMKRAFSMGRSSSVSERYSRIHETAIESAIEESKEERGVRMKIKILKACKRLLRFPF
ncbi:hypothetical protein VNO80_28308 [Phaseolus coccineus]|uniref:Uncharacterized protein n=1 Tax=Phaseolus coccineus TaxID=3886 RepID=A0AAN9L8T5_PHACN